MSLQTVLDNLPQFQSEEIIKAFIKGYSILRRYERPVCSISGGSDSDIMLDIIHRIDEEKKVTYVWFDTGLEYKATKDHLKYLENRYDVEIHRERAVKPIPVCTREYGQPFLTKYVSEMMNRLQHHSFDWADESFDDLIVKYPTCKIALSWWCNNFSDVSDELSSKFNINRRKEFIVENPPTFKISAKCCQYSKKDVAKSLIKRYDCDLMIVGIRKAEGGIRSSIYKNCYTNEGTCHYYRPLFWFIDNDKLIYDTKFDIKHSDCYCSYGFLRTGCVGCPFGRYLDFELTQTKQFEPNMYKAVNKVFKESYEYTKQYKQFVREMEDRARGRKKLF